MQIVESDLIMLKYVVDMNALFVDGKFFQLPELRAGYRPVFGRELASFSSEIAGGGIGYYLDVVDFYGNIRRTGLTVKVNYGEELCKIEEGFEKCIKVTLCNKLYLSQYLTVRINGVPEEWCVINGNERVVGLEHWHGSKVNHTNSFDFVFTPAALKNYKYNLTLEISVNGRGRKILCAGYAY